MRGQDSGPRLGRGRWRALLARLMLETLESRVAPAFVGTLSYDAGTSPVSVAVGDFNGDRVLDLAVANHGSNNVSMLLGNGDGTFGAARNFSVGTNPYSVGCRTEARKGP